MVKIGLEMEQNKKNKVVWLYTHLLFWTGGTRFILEVTQRLKQFWDIYIIVERASPEIVGECQRYGVEVREIGFLTSTNPLYWLLFPLMLRIDENRIKREVMDADVVISGMFPMNVIATKLNKPTIQNCWEPFAFFYDNAMINGFNLPKRTFIRILAALYKHMDISATRDNDVIATLNNSTEEWIKKIYGREGIKTYMGVDSDFFKPISFDHSIKDGKKVILHSTDYTLMKGTGYLIESLPLVVDKIRDVNVLITNTVKNEKEKTSLINKAKVLGVDKYIEFIGTVPYKKLPEYYSLADVVAFTGHPEGIGTTASLTVLEAMACETPVVRSIGCDEEIEDGVSGILVDPRNRVKLAEAIITILMDEDLGKRMGKEGRNRVLTVYNWESVSRKFSDVISGLIKEGGA